MEDARPTDDPEEQDRQARDRTDELHGTLRYDGETGAPIVQMTECGQCGARRPDPDLIANAGRGILVALPSGASEAMGFVPLGRPLLDHVTARPGFEGLARTLLGGVNLIDDLREALAI